MKYCIALILLLISFQVNAQTVAFNNPVRNTQASVSLWLVIVHGYGLNHHASNSRVRYYLNYYQHHRAELEAILKQSRPYLYYIVEALQTRNMPTELALLPAVESGFRTTVSSSSGALGMWQLIPATAQTFNVWVDDYWFDGRADFVQATIGALGYLQYLDDEFNHHWDQAIAAYNSGEGTVQRAINANIKAHKPTHFFDLNLPKETRNYVPKLLAIAIIISHPSRYGIKLPKLYDTPLITKVLITRQISLATAATFANLPLSKVEKLNPAYTYGILPADGPSYLFLPNDQVNHFEYEAEHHRYDEYWNLYRVKPGEFIKLIAKEHQTTSSSIISLNQLQTSIVQPHQRLIVPASNGRTHQIYQIQRGDTLSHIAQQYTSTIPDILAMNGLDPQAPLQIGDRLLVN